MRLATIPHAHPRWLVAGLLAAMVGIMLSGFDAIRSKQGGAMPLYGAEASRARLLVVDRQTDRLSIYDAVNRRPLRQLEGAAAAAMLQRHDGHVFVIAADGTRNEPAAPRTLRVATGNR